MKWSNLDQFEMKTARGEFCVQSLYGASSNNASLVYLSNYNIFQFLVFSGPFLGENPPTNKEVLLKLKGYEKQTGSKYKKDMRYALMKVSNDIKEWWLNTGFKLKTNNGIIYKVQLLKQNIHHFSVIEISHMLNMPRSNF